MVRIGTPALKPRPFDGVWLATSVAVPFEKHGELQVELTGASIDVELVNSLGTARFPKEAAWQAKHILSKVAGGEPPADAVEHLTAEIVAAWTDANDVRLAA